MKALSLFSGAGGMDLGFDRAGITAVAHCEIDPKAASVLRRHWPDVPVISDVREVTSDVGRVDLVHGGFPCQDISVAGNRAGLAGDRSGLWWEFHRILGELRPRWCVIENVAGLLSSNGGRDLGAILGALGDLGYGYAYRVLDARHFGVPQRRRRVFIVGHLGGRGAAEVLLEPEGVRRDPAAGREAGAGASRSSEGRSTGSLLADSGVVGSLTQGLGSGGPDAAHAQNGWLVPQHTGTVAAVFDAKNYSNLQEVLSGSVIPVSVAENQRGEVRTSDVMPALTDGGGKPRQGYPAILAFNGFNGMDIQPSEEVTPTVRAQHVGAPQVLAFTAKDYGADASTVSPTLRSGSHDESHQNGGVMPAVLEPSSLAVRRLTPRECERLMGWPDDWTRYADDGTEIADSHRYRMCGNGVVAPVAEWIGHRIMEADQ